MSLARIFITASIAGVLASCATAPTGKTSEELRALSDEELRGELPRYRMGLGNYVFHDARSDPALVRAEIVRRNPGWPAKVKRDVLKGEVHIGMTAEQVRASWGHPRDVNKTVTRSTVREQWVYGSGLSGTYLYFEDGVLESWQN